MERTVALLAFEDVSNCPVGELLDISQRLKTASEVNAAILTSQSREKGKANLVNLSLQFAHSKFNSPCNTVHFYRFLLTHCFRLFTYYFWLYSLPDPKLPSLLKMLIWAQNQLDEKAAYPRINDLSSAKLEDPAVWEVVQIDVLASFSFYL